VSAFDDYLAQLRRLDEARRTADETAARTATATESLGQRTQRLAEQAAAQRTAVDELARAARTAPPQRSPAPALLGDPAADLAAAEADLHAAGAALEEARFLAHRPPWLPRWRADERNGLVYGVFALACVVVQLIVLRTVRADDMTGAIMLGAILIATPLVAFCLGWLTIGVAARPKIGDEEKKLERNFRLGLVLCGSTLLVACLGFFS
jgi:multidrug efflux pump subunit AcrA (membrane-fusion protein)